MKKWSLPLLLSTSLMTTCTQAQWEGNWLLGVSAGAAWHTNDDDIFITLSAPGTIVENFTISNDSHDDFIWGFLAGYQARCCNWLVGLEVNVDWRDDDDIDFVLLPGAPDTISGTISRNRDPVWGITVRFGYNILSCLMPYIRLGADYSRRDFEFNAFQPGSGISINSGDANDNNWGFVGGVGIEYFAPFLCNLSIRAEWDYHSRRHGDDITAFDATTQTLFTISGVHERHEQTAIASLVYNF